MTSSQVLIDTNVIVSLLNKNDATHDLVLEKIQKLEALQTTFLLNSLILSEVCTVVLLRSKSLTLAKQARQLLTSSGMNYVVTPCDAVLEKQTYQIFEAQAKPQLSVADCSLIAQAKMLSTTQVFTLDSQLQKVLRTHGLKSLA
jgi:predicted nucleic acid-binding protein